MAGKLDGSLPVESREQMLSLIQPGCRLVLDLSGLSEVSGVGVRMLLMFVRMVRAAGGTISATGVSRELSDLVEAAGFLQLFRQAAPAVAPPRRAAALRIDAYPTHRHGEFALRPGFPIPFGATPVARGINFSVYSRHATACTLVLFEPEAREPFAEIPFPPGFRVGDVFAMTVFDLDLENMEYGYRMDGPFEPQKGHRFDKSKVLLDPTDALGKPGLRVAVAASRLALACIRQHGNAVARRRLGAGPGAAACRPEKVPGGRAIGHRPGGPKRMSTEQLNYRRLPWPKVLLKMRRRK
ncbi:MAG: STAS domain-containing protein [Gemmataceae bacterium]|nr:STAS domain-containing protein [Gemmataceae bacterium]